MTSQNFVFPNLPLPSYRRRDRAQLKMREFYISILEKRRQSTDEVSPSPLLSSYFHQSLTFLIDQTHLNPARSRHVDCFTKPNLSKWRTFDG